MPSTRDRILSAAQRLLNVDPAAPMGTIAEAADVSRATIHRHFDSREALLAELGTRSLDRWADRMDRADLEAVAATGDATVLRATLETLVLGYVDDSDDFGFALTDHGILVDADLAARAESLAEREATLFAAAQAAGVLRADLPPRWLGHAVYGLLVAGREALRVGDVARRDAPHLVLSTFLNGVTPS